MINKLKPDYNNIETCIKRSGGGGGGGRPQKKLFKRG